MSVKLPIIPINTPVLQELPFYNKYILPVIDSLNSLITTKNKYIMILFVFMVSVLLFFTTGIKSKMTANPIATITTLGTIIMFFLLFVNRYDNNNLTKFVFISTFGFLLIFLMVYNPLNLFPQMEALNIFFIVLFISAVIVLIMSYDKLKGIIDVSNPIISPYFKLLYSIISIIISTIFILAIYAVIGGFTNDSIQPGSYIINLLVIFGMLGIMYKYLKDGGFLTHPLSRLIINSVLYLPCLFTNVIDMILTEYYKVNYTNIVLIGIELIFILLYLAYPYVATWLFSGSKGTVLINNPVSLNKYRIVSDFNTLNGTDITISDIKDASTIKVGNTVQALQTTNTNFMDATILNVNTDDGTYDVVYTDQTFEYNVTRKNIQTTGLLKVNGIIKCKQNWIVGTIIRINNISTAEATIYTNTYDISYVKWGSQSSTMPGPSNVLPANIKVLNKMFPTNTKYRFSISCWIFLNSMGATTATNSKFVSILNYANNPNIMYNSKTNELIVAVLSNQPTVATLPSIENDPNHVFNIVYSNKQILLQKWNNFVLNYDSGTLDIFYNGELVQSSINISPNVTYHDLTVGTDNGPNGGICNLTYYKEPLDIISINNLYKMSKLKDTPDIPNNLSLFSFNI